MDHSAGAAVDIPKRSLPDPVAAKHWFENFDVVCESHYNNSDKISPDDQKEGTHYHCYDKWWRLAREEEKARQNEQERVTDDAKKCAGVNLPSNYEKWKHELACKGARKAKDAGLDPKLIVAAMVRESGITPGALGDWNGEKYCAHGILQVNTGCSGSTPDTEKQMDMWVERVARYKRVFGDELRGAISWNCPKCASEGYWKEIRYYKLYMDSLKMITS